MIKNKYNVDSPGKNFVGYKQTRKDILSGLHNGKSYAIIGGRRCGKTSLLKRIEKDLILNKDKLAPHVPVPIYCSGLSLGEISTDRLFENMYQPLAEIVNGEQWKSCGDKRAFDNFLKHLSSILEKLVKQFGTHFLVVFLIDELDTAASKLPDDLFFQNLRYFLMDYQYSSNFRLIATGLTHLSNLISSDGSPLSNLNYKRLGILNHESALKLVHVGFPNITDTQKLFDLTGQHPYLLQAFLEKLYLNKKEQWTEDLLNDVAKGFLGDHPTVFRRWISDFGNDGVKVYSYLINESKALKLADLYNQIQIKDMDLTLDILIWHGVVVARDPKLPKTTGTLFKEWFLKNKHQLTSMISTPDNPEMLKSDVPQDIIKSKRSFNKITWALYTATALYFAVIFILYWSGVFK